MQKGILGRYFEDNYEERDQTAPFCLKTARRNQTAPFRLRNARETKMQKVQKFQGRIAIRENLGFQSHLPHALLCFRLRRRPTVNRDFDPDQGRNSPSSKRESCSPETKD